MSHVIKGVWVNGVRHLVNIDPIRASLEQNQVTDYTHLAALYSIWATENDENVTLLHNVTFADPDFQHGAALFNDDGYLHLHRLENQHRVSRNHLVTHRAHDGQHIRDHIGAHFNHRYETCSLRYTSGR
jgi:hypothetical protein